MLRGENNCVHGGSGWYQTVSNGESEEDGVTYRRVVVSLPSGPDLDWACSQQTLLIWHRYRNSSRALPCWVERDLVLVGGGAMALSRTVGEVTMMREA